MTSNQIAYWAYKEDQRHNLAMEQLEKGKLAVSETLGVAQAANYYASADYSYRTAAANERNALSNALNAATNRENALVNARNAAVNERNAATNEFNALTTREKMIKENELGWYMAENEASIGWYNAQTSRQRAVYDYDVGLRQAAASSQMAAASLSQANTAAERAKNDYLVEMSKLNVQEKYNSDTITQKYSQQAQGWRESLLQGGIDLINGVLGTAGSLLKGAR